MYKLCPLYSGSSGNSTFIGNEHEGVLIDAGKNCKNLEIALTAAGLNPEAVKALFITHEHSDHISGLSTICKKQQIPIIANDATLRMALRIIPVLEDAPICEMPTGGTAKKDFFEVTSFAAPHDSVECVGYKITTKYGSVGVMTDAGEETPVSEKALRGCKIVVLEANHDKNMLMTGSYPYNLKVRIAGNHGHLSNDQSGELAQYLVSTGTEKLMLAHLSAENNTPSLALETVNNVLSMHGITDGRDVQVKVAPRYDISDVYILE